MYEFAIFTKTKNAKDLHDYVWSFFPFNEPIRPFLFRQEEIMGRNMVYIRSKKPPQNVPGNMVNEFTPEFHKNGCYRFNLRTISIRRCKDPKTGKMNEKFLCGREAEEWFMDKAIANGFEVKPESLYSQTKKLVFHKRVDEENGHLIPTMDAYFTGELIVTDPERFYNVIQNGIGRMKSMGYGLLRYWQDSPRT